MKKKIKGAIGQLFIIALIIYYVQNTSDELDVVNPAYSSIYRVFILVIAFIGIIIIPQILVHRHIKYFKKTFSDTKAEVEVERRQQQINNLVCTLQLVLMNKIEK